MVTDEIENEPTNQPPASDPEKTDICAEIIAMLRAEGVECGDGNYMAKRYREMKLQREANKLRIWEEVKRAHKEAS